MTELTQEQLDYLEYCRAKFEIDESPLSFYDWRWLNRVEDDTNVSYWPVLEDEYTDFDPFPDYDEED